MVFAPVLELVVCNGSSHETPPTPASPAPFSPPAACCPGRSRVACSAARSRSPSRAAPSVEKCSNFAWKIRGAWHAAAHLSFSPSVCLCGRVRPFEGDPSGSSDSSPRPDSTSRCRRFLKMRVMARNSNLNLDTGRFGGGKQHEISRERGTFRHVDNHTSLELRKIKDQFE